jgi:hypothetical protein
MNHHHTHPGAQPRGTSLADQDEAQLGGPASVLVRQKRDHVNLDRLLHQLENSSGAEQKRVLIRIYRLVFPHAFAEESVLWPVIRRVLPDGESLTRRVEEEHQEVNELVTRLDSDDLAPSERRQVLDRLVEVLRGRARRGGRSAPWPAGEAHSTSAAGARCRLGGGPTYRAHPAAPGRVPTTSGQRSGCVAADRDRQPPRPV